MVVALCSLRMPRRFRRSEPYGAWRGVWNGTREANKSLQPNVLLPESPLREGSEDCLRLNVYTKYIDKPDAKVRAAGSILVNLVQELFYLFY
jgi:hypothetical protein